MAKLSRNIVNMTDKQVAKHLRAWVKKEIELYGWPTDRCGYNQHLKFVEYRNNNWKGTTDKEFKEFVLQYAELLDPKPKKDK